MNTSQDFPRQGHVITAYQPENPDPLLVAAGEEIMVSAKEDPWQGNPAWIWVWCTDPRGKSAWSPANLLERDPARSERATARYDYDAVELAVAAGEDVQIEREESGWYWCRNAQGQQG